MIGFVLFSMKRAWQGFWRNAVMSLAATATMVLMLLLLAGFWTIQTGLLAGLQFTEDKVEVVADLQDNIIDSQVTDLKERIAELPEVATVTYVSREEALDRFRARLAEQGQEDLTRYLESNPLHASLEVKLRDQHVFGDVVSMLRAEPIVSTVKEQQKLVDQVLTVTSILRTAGTVLLLIVGRHRAVHHRQHDPTRGRRPGRGDRDHAARRRLGRLHPLAVRVRGRLRRACSGRSSRSGSSPRWHSPSADS